MKKYVCLFSKEELAKAYIGENRTLEEMAIFLGIKSPITAAKVLHQYGISTNANERKSEKSKHGMSDAEFESFLRAEYKSGKSMIAIADEIGITPSGVRKYFVKYGIERLSKTRKITESPETNPNWHGGKRRKTSGYIEVYCPDHPNANKRKCVYEHQLVMEKHIGRYIKKGEVIHHIDGNKSNNNISNLMLLTNSDHAKLHAIIKRSS